MKTHFIPFLDLDGVLVNWSGGLCKLLDIDPWDPRAQEILTAPSSIQGWKFGSIADVNRVVNEAGYDFWINLELLPWAQDILDICRKYGEVYFLTSPGQFHAAAHAKLDYIWKHFGSSKYILTEHKYVCSGADNHVLIDDYIKNIEQWQGPHFHWPNQWLLKKDPELLKRYLNALDEYLLMHSQ